MKYAFFILLLSHLANASELETCKDFTDEVLTRAIFHVDEKDIKPNGLEWTARFVKDEKEAMKFLNLYDSSKLGIEHAHKVREEYRAGCTKMENDFKAAPNCENAIAILDYFRGLIYGVKNYNWSKKTKAKAVRIIFAFGRKVASTKESNLLDIAVAGSILNIGAEEKLFSKPLRAETVLFVKDVDIESEKLSELSKSKKKPLSCADVKNVMSAQDAVEEKFRPILARLVK